MRARTASVVVVFCLATLAPVVSQQLPDASLRAAYLFNFATFTGWPVGALAPGAPLSICTDDEAVFLALRDGVDGKLVGDHAITSRRLASPDDARRCHIEYRRLPVADGKRLFGELTRAHVLTITDNTGDLRDGSIAQFFIEGRRLRFAIHVTNAERAGLRISSRLLALAVIHRTPAGHTP